MVILAKKPLIRQFDLYMRFLSAFPLFEQDHCFNSKRLLNVQILRLNGVVSNCFQCKKQRNMKLVLSYEKCTTSKTLNCEKCRNSLIRYFVCVLRLKYVQNVV